MLAQAWISLIFIVAFMVEKENSMLESLAQYPG
jgi:hypothetical protein